MAGVAPPAARFEGEACAMPASLADGLPEDAAEDDEIDCMVEEVAGALGVSKAMGKVEASAAAPAVKPKAKAKGKAKAKHEATSKVKSKAAAKGAAGVKRPSICVEWSRSHVLARTGKKGAGQNKSFPFKGKDAGRAQKLAAEWLREQGSPLP